MTAHNMTILESLAPLADTESIKQYDQAVERDYPRNALAFILFEFFWGLALPFGMISTVVPAYLATLNSPKLLVGIVTSFATTLCPFQLFVCHYLRNRYRKKWLTLGYVAINIPWLIYNLGFFFLLPDAGSATLLVGFTISFFLFMAGLIGNQATYFAIFTDSTPLLKRGSLYGYRIGGLALAMLLMSPIAHWVMKHWPEPQNYLVAFAFANGFYMTSSVFLLLLREHLNPQTQSPRAHHRQIKGFFAITRLDLRKLRRNPNYRVFMFAIVLFFIPLMMGSFLVVFAKEKLLLGGSQILTFTLLHMTGSALGAIILGKLADKVGYRILGIIQGALLTVGFLIVCVVAIEDITSPLVIYLGFIFYASVTTVVYMVTRMLSVELMPKADSGMLAALGNMIIMPAILVVVPLCGLIIDLTESYTVVFAVGAGGGATSTFAFATIVREPRKEKMYVIRYLPRT